MTYREIAKKKPYIGDITGFVVTMFFDIGDGADGIVIESDLSETHEGDFKAITFITHYNKTNYGFTQEMYKRVDLIIECVNFL
jgi:hypothetical protein